MAVVKDIILRTKFDSKETEKKAEKALILVKELKKVLSELANTEIKISVVRTPPKKWWQIWK